MQPLLRHETRKPLHPRDRRPIPFTGQRLGFRAVEPHGQMERALGSGKPVALLVLARALVLEIDIELAVAIALEPTTSAQASRRRCRSARRARCRSSSLAQ